MQSDLKRISFRESVGFRCDSLLLNLFIKTNTIDIIWNVNICAIQDQFPLLKDCMWNNLFGLQFFIVFENVCIRVENQIFITFGNEIMTITFIEV